MSTDLMATLIGPRERSVYDATVAELRLYPDQSVYDYPQYSDRAVELGYDDLLQTLWKNSRSTYDLYLRSSEIVGIVTGFRDTGLLFGLPWDIGQDRIEAVAGKAGLETGYVWSDEPLPDDIPTAIARCTKSRLGVLTDGRFELGAEHFELGNE